MDKKYPNWKVIEYIISVGDEVENTVTVKNAT